MGLHLGVQKLPKASQELQQPHPHPPAEGAKPASPTVGP